MKYKYSHYYWFPFEILLSDFISFLEMDHAEIVFMFKDDDGEKYLIIFRETLEV